MVRTPRNIPVPTALASKAAKWTRRYQASWRAATSAAIGQHQAQSGLLCAALRELAYGKCVFCESPLEVSGYLEVEHYHAKTVHQHLAFDWENLLPSCRLCNNAKGDQDHGGVAPEAGHRGPRAVLLDSSRYRPPRTRIRTSTPPVSTAHSRRFGSAISSARRCAPNARTCSAASDGGCDWCWIKV